MKILFMSFLLIMLPLSFQEAAVPKNYNCIPLSELEKESPYKELIYAIGMVECSLDTLAINDYEQAYGYFQIRQIRLDDYKKRTGIEFSLEDMLDYSKAEQVFLYYAEMIGPDDPGLIARKWNGSGPMTWDYWGKVQKHLQP